MGIRQIRINGDEVLRKKSRVIEKIDERLITLVEDMIDTMYDANGVGLAAPQVGILKRVVVIDVGNGPIVLINPEFIEKKGEKIDVEGCLSVPDKQGYVKRPEYVKVKALNLKGKEFTIEGEELLAVALCHEIDHLDGVLYIDKLERVEE